MTSMEPESAAALSGSSVPANVTSSVNSDVNLSSDDVQAMSYQQIMPMLHRLDSARFSEAASAFKQLGDALEKIRANLQQTGNSFEEHGSWRGAAAQKAMDKFQDLHDQASVLSSQCYQAHTSLDWFGKEATPPYQQIPDPQVMSTTEADEIMASPLSAINPVAGAGGAWMASKMGIGPNGQNTADKAARSYLTSYNQQLAKLNQSLPNDPQGPARGGQNFVPPNSGGPAPTAGPLPGSGSAGGIPGSTMPGTGANVPGYSSRSSANPFASSAGHVKVPSTTTPSNASLQGYTAPSAGTGSPFGSGSSNLAGSGGANPFSGMGMMPGGAGAAGEGALGKSGLADGEGAEAGAEGAAGEGAAGEAAGAEAAGAEAGEGAGMNGMPMGGSGGGGSQDKERQRQAWMNEDDSIWGVPDEDIGPTIG